jgi:tRNA-specific 2-thiouridylase
MSDFLRHYVPDSPGEIVDTSGKVLGTHHGLHLYTLGQRKGHGVASPREGMAYVVVGKNRERNQLIVGWDNSDTPGLYARSCTVGTISSINESIPLLKLVAAQPRYRSKAEPARVESLGENRVKLHFERAQRAIAPGQICAFYDGGRLLGGGIFESAE